MKIGVSSYSFKKYIMQTKCDYFHVCDKAKELGFEGIEFINLDDKNFGITTDALKTAAEIKEYCEKIGLSIIAYTVGANFLCDDPEAEIKRVCGCIDVAKALGAPVLRHDVCYALPKNPLYTWRDAIKDMAPRIRRVTEYAKSLGIKTCTENHGYIFQAPERVEELILAVGDENYGWLCDMGNFLCADADPVKAVTIASRFAFHAHTKDFLWKPGTEPRPQGFFGTAGGNHIRGTVIGHGVVPIANCVNILKNAGYDQWLSIEFEGMEENIPDLAAGIDFLKKIV
jgi:sugar phosphate isomerase/epimerase